MKEDWVTVLRDGFGEFCPVVIGADGTIEEIVVGLTVLSSVEEMQKRAARIFEVDDMYEPTRAELIWQEGVTA